MQATAPAGLGEVLQSFRAVISTWTRPLLVRGHAFLTHIWTMINFIQSQKICEWSFK